MCPPLRAGFVFLSLATPRKSPWAFRAGLGAKSMKAAPGCLIEQVQQFGSDRLHVLAGFGSGRSRCELGAQLCEVGRKSLVLGSEAGDLDSKAITLVTQVGVLPGGLVVLSPKGLSGINRCL